MRLFLGCPIPEKAAREMEVWATKSLPAERVRLVPAANLHVTLAFFGEVAAEQVELMTAKVHAVPWRPVKVQTERVRPYGRSAIGLDIDGLLKDPWPQELIDLWLLQPERERRRDPKPHVTVARRLSQSTLGELPKPPAIEFSLDELVLYESILSDSGSAYRNLARAGGVTPGTGFEE